MGTLQKLEGEAGEGPTKNFSAEYAEFKRQISEWNEELGVVVRRHPWTMVLGALCLGTGFAFVGTKKISQLAMDNKTLLSDLLSTRLGINLAEGFDFKKAAETVNSVIGA